jgi:hypothetical protein
MDNKTPTHKITAVEVISDNEGDTFGVKFTFDDGEEDFAFSDSREEAEWDATDRIGEEMPVGMNPKLRATPTAVATNTGYRRCGRDDLIVNRSPPNWSRNASAIAGSGKQYRT